jgi:hypothetical protein
MSCTGPCNQGRITCPTPEACGLPAEPYDPPRWLRAFAWVFSLAMIGCTGAAIFL